MIETGSNRDAARLRSIRGKGAGAWLDSIPSSEKFALSSGNFVLAASLRLGLPLSLPPWATKCECGKSLDVEGYHLLTCKMGGGPVWSHNYVVLCWSECMSSLQCQHQIEPKDRYTTSNNRADIVVFDSTCGGNVELDVALAHPWSQDILRSAATTDGAAARRREDIKHNKYSQEQLPGGYTPTLIPLVFEHFGGWGEEASTFLDKLSKLYRDEEGRNNPSDFKTHWRRRLSVQLQRCNASVLARKMIRVTYGQNTDQSLDVVQLSIQ